MKPEPRPRVDSVLTQVAFGIQLPIAISGWRQRTDPKIQLSGPLAISIFTSNKLSLISYEFGKNAFIIAIVIITIQNKLFSAYCTPGWPGHFLDHLISPLPSFCEAGAVIIPSY